MESGAVAVGFSKAGEIDAEVAECFNRWIGDNRHAGMDYMKRHASLKLNPENVLPGVKSVISLAFSYVPSIKRNDSLPVIALYAY